VGRRKAIEESILRTVFYADVFDYCLNLDELFHFLIAPTPVAQNELADVLADSPLLRRCLSSHDGLFFLQGRESLPALRAERHAYSSSLWPRARAFGERLGGLPFVRGVAVSGSLTAANPKSPSDDADYFIITADERVWLSRAFVILMVRAGRLTGFEICPNFMVAEHALEVPEHDVFTAHEIARLRPIWGVNLFRAFFRENRWIRDFLPNSRFVPSPAAPTLRSDSRSKVVLERCFSGALGNLVEGWEYRRKRSEFADKLSRPGHSAVLNPRCVKGHFQDHRGPAKAAYVERLRRYGIPDWPQ
jgi:hypothetical protein